MFKALVLVCLISNPNACFVAEDQRGPYSTQEKCMDRIAEMSIAIMNLDDHAPVSYRCQKIKGESANGEQPSSNNKQNLKSPA